MNRVHFQRLARLRIKKAKVLLDSKHYQGAYYLAGYAVECALKACIAKKTKRHDFPPKVETVRDYYTHKLETLVRSADLKGVLKDKENSDSRFKSFWAVVKDWNSDIRYDLEIDERRSRDLYSAITNNKHGVLTWFRKFW